MDAFSFFIGILAGLSIMTLSILLMLVIERVRRWSNGL